MKWPFSRKSVDIDPILRAWWGPPAASGVRVNADSALRVTAVLAATRVLAEGIAQVPLKLFQEQPSGDRLPAKDHPLYRVLYLLPNEWQTAFEFRETLMYHAVLTGNGFAFINRVRGQVRELIPLIPGRVTIRQMPDYSLEYRVTAPSGEQDVIPRSNLLHLRGPSWNSYSGMDAVQLAREAIGLAIATEESQAKLHGNGARPGGILSVEGTLDKDAVARLRTAWAEFQGSGNSFKTAIFDKKTTFQPMAMTGVDSQHLETRRFQIEEIARAMRVFPQMIMQSDKTSTYASAEQFFIAHVTHSLGPWFERWEEVIQRDLLTADELTEGYIPRFNVNALLRGDAQSRANFYRFGILDGWMVRNEARALEDMNPLPGLDEPLQPLNMTSTARDGSGPLTTDPAPPAADVEGES